MIDRFELMEFLYRLLGRSGKRVFGGIVIVTLFVTSQFFPDFFTRAFKSSIEYYAQVRSGEMVKLVQPMFDSFKIKEESKEQ